jgi:hypothetical protein
MFCRKATPNVEVLFTGSGSLENLVGIEIPCLDCSKIR